MLALACLIAGGVVGAVRKPPSEDNASVFVYPIKPAQLKTAGIPDFAPPPLVGAKFHANTTSGLGSGSIKTSRENESEALDAVRAGTTVYLDSLLNRQNRWLSNALAQGSDPKLRGVRRAALRAHVRYAYKFVSPSTGAGSLSAPLRGALLGLLVAGLAGALISARRRTGAVAPADGPAPNTALARPPPTAIQISIAALAAAGLVALSSHLSTGADTFGFIALLFAVAFVYALAGGTRAIRVLLIAVIAIAPVRGASSPWPTRSTCPTPTCSSTRSSRC